MCLYLSMAATACIDACYHPNLRVPLHWCYW